MNASLIRTPWSRRASCLAGMLLAILSACRGMAGATNFVVAGDDLQARIHAAGAGDIMVVQSGSYDANGWTNGSFAIDKPLTFVRSGTEPAILNSPISIASTGTVTFARIDFGGTMSLGQSNGAVRIHDGNGINIEATGGALTLRRCTFGALTLRGTRLEAIRLTNTGDLTLVGHGGSQPKVPAVLVQGRCDGFLRASEGMSLMMGYYSMHTLLAQDCELTGVGVQVFNVTHPLRMGTASGAWAAAYLNRCSSRWWNSQFFWSAHGNSLAESRTLFAIQADASSTTLMNCDLIVYGAGYPGSFGADSYGVGLYGGASEIRNCFFHVESTSGANRMVHVSTSGGVQLTDCAGVGYEWFSMGWPEWQGDSLAQGHAWKVAEIANGVPINPINCRWLMAKDTISFPTEGPQALRSFQVTLATNSPLLNAGSADPIYRNRDGTRNTIGSTGGPLYNPANATTDQPIAFWLGLLPQRIVKGSVNTIKLEAAAASGH